MSENFDLSDQIRDDLDGGPGQLSPGACDVSIRDTGAADIEVCFRRLGSANIKRVLLRWNGLHEMAWEAATNSWIITLPIRRGARIAYQFVVDPAGEGLAGLMHPDYTGARREPSETGRNVWSVLTLPDARPFPWAAPDSNDFEGELRSGSIRSRVFSNVRRMWAYLPPAGSRSDCALLILFDGVDFLRNGAHRTIDRLIRAKVIKPTIVLFVENVVESRWRELRCCDEVGSFVAIEILPWAAAHFNLSSRVRDRVVGGYSRGGLAAAWVAFKHSMSIGGVLCHSGSFWWAPDVDLFDAQNFNGYAEPAWFTKQILREELRDVRFYLDVGTYEGPHSGQGDILTHTRYLRDALQAKGYTVYFQEFVGGHDFLNWRGTIADGLQFLLPS